MLLKDALDQKKFDKRLQDKHVESGKVTKKELDEFVAALEDDSSNKTTTTEARGKAGMVVQ